MTVTLDIDTLVIDSVGAGALNSVSFKEAVERELAALIEAGDATAGQGKPRATLNDSARREAGLARDLARRLYREIKR